MKCLSREGKEDLDSKLALPLRVLHMSLSDEFGVLSITRMRTVVPASKRVV